MKSFVRLFVFLIVMTSSVVMYGDGVSKPNWVTDVEQASSSDGLRGGDDLKREKATAVLTDAQDAYRICSSRPQRLLPANGFKLERTSGKQSFSLYFKPPKRRFSCRWAIRNTSPIRTVVSCDYYVFALRRLLC